MKNSFLLIITALFLINYSSAQTAGNIGIGTTVPTSRLQIAGSLAVGYRIVTASTTLSVTDYALEFTGSSAATITLPDATLSTGRIYTIKNSGTGSPAPVVTVSPYAGQTIDAKADWKLRRSNESISLVSNGTHWKVSAQEANVRNNYVLVKAVSDFPAAVSGVITLVAGTVYDINGTITLTDKIDLNGCQITGLDVNYDKLVYTPTSGELFTGTNGGAIYNVTLSATGVGSKLFNIDAGGAAYKRLNVEHTTIMNCNNVGLIKGFGGVVYFQTVVYVNNTNGITFQNLSDFAGVGEIFTSTNRNIFQKFVGTFNTILLQGCEMNTLSSFSATALDISGITSITTGAALIGTIFYGTGTYVTGTFSNEWEADAHGIPTEKDDLASANIYLSSTSATTFPAVNTPRKVLGTTTSVNLYRVSSPASNRLTYTGHKTKRFMVSCALTFTSAANNKNYSFYIAKNGVKLSESEMSTKISTGSDQQAVPITCTVPLSMNDYIEVWCENNTDNTSMTVISMNLSIK